MDSKIMVKYKKTGENAKDFLEIFSVLFMTKYEELEKFKPNYASEDRPKVRVKAS
jgi:hypothetical protein